MNLLSRYQRITVDKGSQFVHKNIGLLFCFIVSNRFKNMINSTLDRVGELLQKHVEQSKAGKTPALNQQAPKRSPMN